MEIIDLIKELENQLTDNSGIFRKKINSERCLDILDEMRAVAPQLIRESSYILANKQKILENADIVAKNTIREAEDRVGHIIDNSEIVRRAELEGKSIVDAAYVQCDSLIQRTKEHLDGMFRETEEFLLTNMTMIRTNREELRTATIIQDRRK